jgi:L-ascorbate metabolism protein UlaG (beta-lactamase superfamily)
MAEVAQSGAELLRDINEAETGPGRGCFWWMGQLSFALKLAGRVLYFDPYLDPSPHRQTPPLFTPDQVTNAGWILCTHDHGDHIDPTAIPGLAKASPNARFVVPRPHRKRMLDLGVPEPQLRLLSAGESLHEDGLTITGVKAKHEFFYEQADGFPYLGYVVEADGLACYDSGDTVIYEGLLTTLQRWHLDLAVLPINGRDPERYRRGCIGNMTYQEAVDLAGELEVALTIPAHWDMFRDNSEDPQKFLDYLAVKWPERRAWVGRVGERVPFGPEAR